MKVSVCLLSPIRLFHFKARTIELHCDLCLNLFEEKWGQIFTYLQSDSDGMPIKGQYGEVTLYKMTE